MRGVRGETTEDDIVFETKLQDFECLMRPKAVLPQALRPLSKRSLAPGHVTSSCLRPEEHVKCAHCSAVILYVFFAILAKSQFVISINNSTETDFIYPQFH